MSPEDSRGPDRPEPDELARLLHDLRTPVSAIRAACRALEQDLPAGELRQRTGLVLGEIDRLVALLDGCEDRAQPREDR